MINPDNSSYIREREDFHSDKCSHCMSYLNDNGDCTDKFCSGHEDLYRKVELNEFIFNLQELNALDGIHEVMGAGFTDEEIIYIFKEISFNDTFKFKK
tara:strand:- start:8133 stop:8426 length:294 start_codon:yes stop_codon:yes gene_type:complete